MDLFSQIKKAITMINRVYRGWRYLLVAMLLQGCMSTPQRIHYYDFGAAGEPLTAASCSLPLIQLDDITAPASLSSNYMLYRLLYNNDQQSYTYAQHRWNMTPTQLLTQRIKMRLSEQGTRFIDSGINVLDVLRLQIELEDFNQYYTDAEHSYAQIQLRATLLKGRTWLAQTMLQQQVPANAPNAQAGAEAMRIASDKVIANLGEWLCESEGRGQTTGDR
jgi:cholesterol transport system auxiliary component